MRATDNSNKEYNTGIRILFILSILIPCFFVSCGNKNEDYVDLPYDRELTPTMKDDSVTLLLSDSGIIRYKMITKEWLIFEKSSDPHWFFPQGIYVEQFDTAFNKQASLKADTAWNYTQKKLWKLKGNVFMRNIKDETFQTQEVFWDERERKIYSEKYIEIHKPDELTLKGIGFESNSEMTKYKVFRPFDTDLVVNDSQNQPTNNLQKQDSIPNKNK